MSYSKDMGTRHETAIVKALRDVGFSVQRQPLAGTHDVGDIALQTNEGLVIIEVKCGQQCVGYTRKQKEKWLAETNAEWDNAGATGAYLIIAPKYKNMKDWEVWTASGHMFQYFDEFIAFCKDAYLDA